MYFLKKRNFKNPLFDNADNALVQYSARDELNRTHITIQNLASRGEG